MRAGERGVDELARVRVASVDRQLVALLHGAADLVDVGEVDLRVDALAEQVQAERGEADVAGPLAVAEQRALDPVRPGQQRQLGVGDRRAAVVVRVDRERRRSSRLLRLRLHPLDLVGEHVRGVGLHRAGQVERHLAVRSPAPRLQSPRRTMSSANSSSVT